MTPEERLTHQVEAWKVTVQVQQHFNDIEWKIRGLALTLLTVVLGATALAVRYSTDVSLFGANFQLASALLVTGLIVWLMFYFVDQVWYHRLLLGAVRHGERLEELIAEAIPGFGLTTRISKESPYEFNFGIWKPRLHSRHKLQAFYGVVAALLLTLAIAIQVDAHTHIGSSPRQNPGSVTTTTSVTSPGRVQHS